MAETRKLAAILAANVVASYGGPAISLAAVALAARNLAASSAPNAQSMSQPQSIAPLRVDGFRGKSARLLVNPRRNSEVGAKSVRREKRPLEWRFLSVAVLSKLALSKRRGFRMPLIPLPDRSAIYDHTGVRFAMKDGEKIVWCWISGSALDELCGDVASSFQTTYERFRDKFEAAASRKFDRGGVSPNGVIILDTDDLWEEA